MALSNEDKKDVSTSYGKALANKISKVTKDRKPPAYKLLGLSRKQWADEGKPKAHF